MTDTPDNSQLATVTVQAAPLVKGQAAAEMRAWIEDHQERRAVAITYIKDNFKEGVDYGPADPRSDKKTLLKPGGEKLCRLFNTMPRWEMDRDTWTMLGGKPGVVCYRCTIISKANGEVVGEGRGAGTVGAQGRDENKAVKIAEKRAIIDAALYTFCLSELFTQDLEDEARLASGEAGDDAPTPAGEKDKLVLRREIDQYIKDRKIAGTLPVNKLIAAAVTTLLKKVRIETMAELQQVRASILAGDFDLETGSLIPPMAPPQDPPPDDFQGEGGQEDPS